MSDIQQKSTEQLKKLGKELVKECGKINPDLKKIEELLGQGASPNCVGWNGDTPLSNAIYRRNIDLVKYLFAHGARIESYSLEQALRTWNIGIIKAVVEEGCSGVSFKDISRVMMWTPSCIYMFPTKKKRQFFDEKKPKILEYLLGQGVRITDVFVANTRKNLLLDCAQKTGDPVCVEIVKREIERQEKATPSAALLQRDPRDERIAQLQEQIRNLASVLTSVQRELEDIKNPKVVLVDKSSIRTTRQP